MRPGAMTSEFWLTLATMISVLVCVITDNLEGVPYITGLAAVYVSQRGMVKSISSKNSEKGGQ